MDEFLNDEQLKRLFDRNLPKQPLPPDMAERLLRRVNADVRATYSPQQRPQSLARQLAQRRTPTQTPPVPLTTAVAKSSGRSWIFSSSPSAWLTFVGTVAAAVMFAVLFSRTSILGSDYKDFSDSDSHICCCASFFAPIFVAIGNAGYSNF